MQIQESDLTAEAASTAEEELKSLSDVQDPDTVQDFGILNRRKRVTGYALRRQALDDVAEFGASSEKAAASTDEFCRWLIKDGFWYD